MRQPQTVRALEVFGRVRLSESFFMRDFLYSEIAAINGFANLPDNPDLAIAAGKRLCEELLEPLQARFGRISVRSAYRSPEVNAFGDANTLNCSTNEKNFAGHIWDRRDNQGRMGATACVIVNRFIPIMSEPAIGKPWPGGSTTSCLTPIWSSSQNSQRSTCSGAKNRSAAFTVSSHRAAGD